MMSEIILEKGEAAVFGYGSLMLKESMEKTLGRDYTGTIEPVVLEGWKRSWSVKYPNECFYYSSEGCEVCPENIVYLNLQAEPDEKVNGTLFIVKEEELEAFDERESVYDRVHVSGCLEGTCVEGGDIYTYRAKPEYFIENPHAFDKGVIRQSYVQLVHRALECYGKEFMAQYFSTTDSLPEHLVVEDFTK